MDEVDWSKLSKKERRRLAKEQKKQSQELQKKQTSMGKWLVIAFVVIIIALGGFWLFKESSKPLPGSFLADQGRDHVSKSEWQKFEYNSNPPTSGPHDGEWTKGGVYTKSPGDGHLIHSLEHGYVVISHNCEMTTSKVNPSTSPDSTPIESGSIGASSGQKSKVGTESAEIEDTDIDCLEFVGKLKERVEKDSWKLILVPRPNLDTNFALTAWRRIDKFSIEEANMIRVENFISALRNAGPEQTME